MILLLSQKPDGQPSVASTYTHTGSIELQIGCRIPGIFLSVRLPSYSDSFASGSLFHVGVQYRMDLVSG